MKQFILVAGDDYERKGVDFSIFCYNRMKRAVAGNNARDDLRFQIFNVKAGAAVAYNVTYVGGRRIESQSTIATFTPVTSANYDSTGTGANRHFYFKDGQTGMMSITDIYVAARSIGVNDPGTLFELSFFSHAWHGGPILVNSADDGSYEALPGMRVPVGAARDPDDRDPRPSKDFSPPTMTPAQLQQFKDSYSPDGYSWSWGCAFFRLCHEILHKLEHHRDYRSSGIPDHQVFTFTSFRAEHVAELASVLGMAFPDPRNVAIRMGDLKRFFCLLTVDSYTHHLAVASGKKAYGGVIGTYSEYDAGPRPLMHVHKGFARHFRFYQNYLGFKLDRENRMYGEYSPGFAC